MSDAKKRKAKYSKSKLTRRVIVEDWIPHVESLAPSTALQSHLSNCLKELGYVDHGAPSISYENQLLLSQVSSEAFANPSRFVDYQQAYTYRCSRGEKFQRVFDSLHFYSSFFVFGEWLTQAIMDLPSGSQVLDIGTGNGTLLNLVAAQRPDLVFVGIDINASSLEVARADAKRLGVSNVVYQLIESLDQFLEATTPQFACVITCRLLHEYQRIVDAPWVDPRLDTFPQSKQLIPEINNALQIGGRWIAIERIPHVRAQIQFARDVSVQGLSYRKGSLERLAICDLEGPEMLPVIIFERTKDAVLPTPLEVIQHRVIKQHANAVLHDPEAYQNFLFYRHRGSDLTSELGSSRYGPARWVSGRLGEDHWLFVESCGPNPREGLLMFTPQDHPSLERALEQWKHDFKFRSQ
jgi:SAM-dependent methyltransferase